MNMLSTKQAGAREGGAALISSRAVSIFMAMVLGLVIVGVVGFSHVEAVHNAAHDYRHSMSFPCH
jgi:cobalt transporter subunit CbtB